MTDRPPSPITGIHHLTAFVSDPNRCVRFYRDLLGLRMIKQTVNYDDTDTWHLYFADATGRPGTVLTFFPWPDAAPGRPGRGQITATTLAIPPGALEYWRKRLADHVVDDPLAFVGERNSATLTIRDDDGLIWQLFESPCMPDRQPWSASDVPADCFIGGISGVSLVVADVDDASAMLEQVLGASRAGDDGIASDATRWTIGSGDSATITIISAATADAERGRFGPGTVHHVAWRIGDDAAQQAWRDHLLAHDINVTDIRNRTYFRSIYFRGPGGVVFEMATDGPGFMIDESPDSLGTALQLPDWLESDRARIESVLPPLSAI